MGQSIWLMRFHLRNLGKQKLSFLKGIFLLGFTEVELILGF